MKCPACLLLSVLLAAGPAEAAEPKAPAVELEAIAKKFLDRLAAGDFATAVKSFDPTMTAALPPDKLAEVWKSLNAQAGLFQRQTGVRAAKESKYQVIFVVCKFEKAVLEAKVVFDDSKRIAGLFFVPPPGVSDDRPPGYDRPESYRDAQVRVGQGDWSLPGTLSIPVRAGPVPGIVLVHGSGPLDRDETIGPNRPFRDLASGLASRGVAVLRYDKRTLVHAARLATGRDTLTLHEGTVADAVDAVALLRRSRGVDGRRVFVLGHSLGGVALPRIAALEPGIAGYVMLATPSRPLQDVYREQMTYLVGHDGYVRYEERARLESIGREVERVDHRESTGASGADAVPLGLGRAYWDDLRRHGAAEAAARLSGPVLVMQGGRDYQVTREDFEGWQRLLAGRSNVAFKLYPSLNHLFIEGEGRSTPDEDKVAGDVAARVFENLGDWLKNRPRRD